MDQINGQGAYRRMVECYICNGFANEKYKPEDLAIVAY